MPKPKRGHRLGSGPDHQALMLGTLAAQLFTHERIRTTEAKAKALRPFAERDGGYTRILKLGQRKGDGAPMALIELLAEEEE